MLFHVVEFSLSFLLTLFFFPWQNIAGTVMDPNDLQLLAAELKDLHVPMQPMPNVWIAEVRCLDPRNEAWSILNQLRS